MKKTTIEIPDRLFQQAKIRAAQEGLSMRDLVIQGLQLSLETRVSPNKKKRVGFPLIRAPINAPRLTDKQVSAALNTDEDLA